MNVLVQRCLAGRRRLSGVVLVLCVYAAQAFGAPALPCDMSMQTPGKSPAQTQALHAGHAMEDMGAMNKMATTAPEHSGHAVAQAASGAAHDDAGCDCCAQLQCPMAQCLTPLAAAVQFPLSGINPGTNTFTLAKAPPLPAAAPSGLYRPPISR